MEINDNLDIEKFFPHSSAFSTDKARVTSIFSSLTTEGAYASNGHWKVPEGPMSSEEKWAQIFDRVLYHAGTQRRCAEWHYMRTYFTWTAHEKTTIDALRKPAVILVPKSRKDVPFGTVLTYTEVKETNTKSNVDTAVRQLQDCAGLALASQVNRDYFVGAVLAGRSLKIVLCARDVTYCSTPINIDDSPQIFIRAIIALSAGYAENLGFDPLFTIDPENSESWAVELNGIRLAITRRLFVRSVTMTGRGTRVLLCRDEKNTPYVLKDSWVPDGESDEVFVHNRLQTLHQLNPLDSGTMEDIFGPTDIFNVFRGCRALGDLGRGLPGIPVVSYTGYAAQSTLSISNRFSGDDLSFTQRKHLRVLLRTCGVPITWFSSRREFLNSMMCAVIGHFNGERHNFLHCDISEPNIWLCVEDPEVEEQVILPWNEEEPNEFPKHAAVLGDWGKAVYHGLSSPGFDGTKPGAGSYPFISAEMASQAGVEGLIPHSTIHDLESLFWVIWIVSINTTGPYNSRRQWSDKPDPHTGFRGSTRKALDADAKHVQPPAWATPGIHPVSLAEIQAFKLSIPKPTFFGAMSPYWKDGEAGRVFQDGMRKLRGYFKWTEVSTQGFQPRRTITHQIFIDILRDMRDNIPPEEDRQTMDSVRRARARYGRMMADPAQDMSTGLLSQSSTAIRPFTSGRKRKAKEVPGTPDDWKRTRGGGGQAWGEGPSGHAQGEEGRGASEASVLTTDRPEAEKETSASPPRKSRRAGPLYLRKFRS